MPDPDGAVVALPQRAEINLGEPILKFFIVPESEMGGPSQNNSESICDFVGQSRDTTVEFWPKVGDGAVRLAPPRLSFHFSVPVNSGKYRWLTDGMPLLLVHWMPDRGQVGAHSSD